jgi:short subunit dehydrogenase-like uncharacterized protein
MTRDDKETRYVFTKFDIVVYGATGFTASSSRISRRALQGDASLKWAMAGRSKDKLAAVRDAIGAPKDRR